MYASLKTHGNFRVLPGVYKLKQGTVVLKINLRFDVLKIYFSESTEISVSPFAYTKCI